MLIDLIDDLVRQGTPADQITLGGFSQGCIMTMDVGLRYPQKLAGLVGISGCIIEPEILFSELAMVAKEQRVLMTHGPHDEVIEFSLTRRQVKLMQRAGLKVQWNEFPKGHTFHGEEELVGE